MTERDRPGLSIDCVDVLELVTDYLEGALPVELASEVEAHLALCDSCRIYLDQMRITIDELGRVPVDTLSPHAQEELVAAFRSFHAASRDTSGP